MILYELQLDDWFSFGSDEGDLKPYYLFDVCCGSDMDWNLVEACGQRLHNNGLVKCY